MLLEQGLRILFLAVVLTIDNDRCSAVLGQTPNPVNPSVKPENNTFRRAWSNASDRDLNFSNIFADWDAGDIDNAGPDEDTLVSVIDAGSISKQRFQIIQMICYFAIIPIISFLGIVGNTLSLRTLLNQKPRYAITVYLNSLSVTDTLVLIVAYSLSVFRVIGTFNPLLGGRIRVALFSPVELFGYVLVMRMSAFLTTALSLDRAIAVNFPFRIKGFFLSRYPWRVVSGLFISLFVFFFPNLFRFNVFLSEVGSSGKPLLIVIPSNFSQSVPLFYTYYGLVGQILTTIFPLIAVFICNLTIVISLRTSARYRQTIMTNHQ